MDVDIDGDGFLSFMESLAETYVIAQVFIWIFHFFAWPFISIARAIVFVLSFGKIRPSYRQAYNQPIIYTIGVLLFFPFLMWFLVIVAPKFYV